MKPVAVVAALAFPCLIFAALAVLGEVFPAALPDALSNVISFGSCVVGFLLLTRMFRQRALPIAIVYFPLMFGLFIYVSIAVVSMWFQGP